MSEIKKEETKKFITKNNTSIHMLYCKKCMKEYHSDFFYNNRTLSSGKSPNCKKCTNDRARELKQRKRADVKSSNSEEIKQIAAGEQELETLDIEKEVIVDGKLKHFTSLFVAQSESGKTVLMMYLIKMLRKHYDMVILVSKNIQAESYDLSKFDFYTNEMYLDKVVYAIRYLQRTTNNKFNILLIVDDIKTRQKATIQDLFTNGRNSNITIMNLVQHPTMIDNHIRTNCKFIFLFNQKNPELIRGTMEKFLFKFVKTPKEAMTRLQKEEYLENWLQHNTQNYTSIVLNIKSGKIQKIKAVL